MSATTSVVVDTHALIWYLSADPRLSSTAAKILNRATTATQAIFVSAVTLVELRYLVEKDTFDETEFTKVTRAIESDSTPFAVAPMDANVALGVGSIPRDVIRDPWDRMIAATALTLEIPLVTCDAKLRKLKSPTSIW